jgi:hypothetical protein
MIRVHLVMNRCHVGFMYWPRREWKEFLDGLTT